MEYSEEHGNERSQADLDRVRGELLLELSEHDVKNQLIDLTPEAEHARCINYLKTKSAELEKLLPWSKDWPEKIIDDNESATIMLAASNLYRMEKEFQDGMLQEATSLRFELEKLLEMQSRGEPLDNHVLWSLAYMKVTQQIVYDVYYGKHVSDPWQQYFDAVTQPIPSVNYGEPMQAGIRALAEGSVDKFDALRNIDRTIFLEAARTVGLFKIVDDPDSVTRLAAIIVEVQDLARFDPGEPGYGEVERERRIREYGRRQKIGEKLISTLVEFFSKRYLFDKDESL